MLLDRYLVDRGESSARVFRVYRATPAHFHRHCDEHLYVLSGRGTFWTVDRATESAFAPGHFLFFGRGTVHAMPTLLEHPVVFLAIDTPRRHPEDVCFIDTEDGTAASFIKPA
ncbi:cupin domain-containing protein [Acidipila sp. EB88]|nr:cupin domain-containing protein [Acidipila sp. EB88]